MVVDITDIITCANFGEDRLRGLGAAGGQNLPFSIDFDRRPYNTLALPCDCVIQTVTLLTLLTLLNPKFRRCRRPGRRSGTGVKLSVLPLTLLCLSPPKSTTQTTSPSVQPFRRAHDRDRQTDRKTTLLRL